jgi:hypothetical protein
MNRIYIIKIFLLLLPTALLVAGCNREDDFPFSGNDNYIAAFTLEKDGITLKGAVSTETIVVTASEQFSLSGATATVTLSENASIMPDPATITDWDAAQTFTVTAYTGTKRTYAYRVERQLVSLDGDIVLQTQSDVNNFVAELKAQGIDQINGNISIALKYEPEDSITSLAGLEQLKIVTGDILVNYFYKGDEVSAFEKLEKVNGLSMLSSKVKRIRFPKLSVVHAAFIIEYGYTEIALLETVDFPELTIIDANLKLYGIDSVTTLNFPKLQQVSDAIEISGRNFWNSKLQTLDFPELTTVKRGISVFSLYNLEKISAPKLETVGLLSINGNSIKQIDFHSLKTIDGNLSFAQNILTGITFPALETIGGTMSFSSVPTALTTLQFPVLKSVRNLTIPKAPGLTLTAQSFPALKYVEGNLQIEELENISSLNIFSSLDSVGGSFYLLYLPNLTSLSGLSSIKKIGSFAFILPQIRELDVRGIQIDELLIYLAQQTENLALTGDDEFPGKLTITDPPSNVSQLPLTIQAGFKTVGNLEVSTGYSASSLITDLDFPWLEKVIGLLYLSYNSSVKRVNFPNLQETGAIRASSYLSSLETIEMPRLEKITGYVSGTTSTGFIFPLSSSNITAIEAPRLKSIEGELSITGLTAARKLETIGFPALESLTGTLTITGTNNTTFTDLSGFSTLTSAGGVTVSGFTQINDFEPLKKVIPSLSADTWTITGCGYNPTYQDMVDGRYVNH